MAAPTYFTPPTPTTGISGTTLTLTPPATDNTGFYVVKLDFPPGSDSTDWTPVTAPAFVRPRDTYDQRWPTITNWEVPSFVLAVRGSVDLPTLEWTFPTAFDLGTVLKVEVGDCSFQLRAQNVLDAAEYNQSPAAQPGALYSIRGGMGQCKTDTVPEEEQVATTDFPASPVPAQAVLNGESVTSFCAMVPTIIAAGPPTIPDDTLTPLICTWTPNYAVFFPDVWGSTLSIYPPGDDPGSTYGWHTGRIGWG